LTPCSFPPVFSAPLFAIPCLLVRVSFCCSFFFCPPFPAVLTPRATVYFGRLVCFPFLCPQFAPCPFRRPGGRPNFRATTSLTSNGAFWSRGSLETRTAGFGPGLGSRGNFFPESLPPCVFQGVSRNSFFHCPRTRLQLAVGVVRSGDDSCSAGPSGVNTRSFLCLESMTICHLLCVFVFFFFVGPAVCFLLVLPSFYFSCCFVSLILLRHGGYPHTPAYSQAVLAVPFKAALPSFF